MNPRCLLLYVCRVNNVPEFRLNYEGRVLALMVTVTNANGDDAYEAKVVGTFPDVVSYSGVRKHEKARRDCCNIESVETLVC